MKKIIINTAITIVMETIWAMLLVFGILILMAEDQTAVAILAAIGLISNIIMIVNEFVILSTRLELLKKETIENYLKN